MTFYKIWYSAYNNTKCPLKHIYFPKIVQPPFKEAFRLKNIRIRQTISKKKIKRFHCALSDLHNLQISFFSLSYYMPFLASFKRCFNVNHVEGGLNPSLRYYQFTLQFCSGKATSIIKNHQEIYFWFIICLL